VAWVHTGSVHASPKPGQYTRFRPPCQITGTHPSPPNPPRANVQNSQPALNAVRAFRRGPSQSQITLMAACYVEQDQTAHIR
jgi:hypothetical protein